VTRIARQMVGRWGMSDAVGPISILPSGQDASPFFPGTPGRASDRTLELVDAEVRRIVEECYEEAIEKLRANRQRLDALAQTLLRRETLDESEAYAVAGVDRRGDVEPERASAL
jgi:cell division protease FtsH